ncbi:hypothetical protein ASF58_23465 [Methylobacterium sp. Leaf125]|uniref:hypothetical protein n=1 Tax=Methylobacterium sp. Leaf125 TaxID=1736265 RepID=UPI0006FBA569|nr:hypothetical protein [Methylobacterium sp. Leaf125]KQQ37530.1 hypothetical protein ASF58_23465 [Methylobacterium sp. Leaf125]
MVLANAIAREQCAAVVGRSHRALTEPARAPLAPALRLLDRLGEAVAALSLICGGLLVIGLATLA